MFGADWLANLFLGVFLFGLIFTAASLLLGFSHVGGLHAGHSGGGHTSGPGHSAHVHVAGHHVNLNVSNVSEHLEGHADLPGHDGPGIFNMPTMMAFLTWFGGVGYILRHSFSFGGGFAVALALFSGLAGGAVMFVLLARVLWPMMSQPLSASDYRLPGTPARVVSPIRAGGVGEIVYVKDGTRFTAGARCAGEEAIARGTEVVILRYEKGMAYVQDVNALLDDGRRTTDDNRIAAQN